MAGELVPLVMIPRYSTYANPKNTAVDFVTIAMDVTPYQSAILNAWRTALLPDGSPSASVFKMYFEESTDQVSWSICSGTSGSGEDPGNETEDQFTATLKKRWFRVRIALTGTDAVVTCWCVGFLEERER